MTSVIKILMLTLHVIIKKYNYFTKIMHNCNSSIWIKINVKWKGTSCSTKYLHSPVVCLQWSIVKEKFIKAVEYTHGHVKIDLVFRQQINEINVTMKRLLSSNFSAKYEYKDGSTIFSFSFGYKMQRAWCKSLRIAFSFTRFTHDPLNFISQWKPKNLNSILNWGLHHNFSQYLVTKSITRIILQIFKATIYSRNECHFFWVQWEWSRPRAKQIVWTVQGSQAFCLFYALIRSPWTQKKDTHSLYLQCFQ